MLTIKDYAKYPFLPSAANCLKSIPDLQKPIITIIETKFGKDSLNIAKLRLSNALYKTNFQLTTDKISNPQVEIASFFFARVLLSVQHNPNKTLIDKFVNYETERFYNNYSKESYQKKQEIEKDMKITSNKTRFALTEYIPLSVKLAQSSARWKLINMTVKKGIVDVSLVPRNKFDKTDEEPAVLFFKAQIKYFLKSKLPISTLDRESRTALDPIASEIFGQFYQSIENTDYGEVTESNFPPCIQKTIDLIKNHDNPTHIGRFAMVSFLHEIGMTEERIVDIFKTVRDFDLSQVIYQVDHITGKLNNSPYKCPACDAMRTNGLCLGKDNALCAKVKHPLGYYQAKCKFNKKK